MNILFGVLLAWFFGAGNVLMAIGYFWLIAFLLCLAMAVLSRR